jgi:hypothetical protein
VNHSLLREFIHDHAAALLLFALVLVAACPVRCAEAQEMSRASSVETIRGPVCAADSTLAAALWNAPSWWRSLSGYVPIDGQIYAPPVQGSTSTATSTATSICYDPLDRVRPCVCVCKSWADYLFPALVFGIVLGCFLCGAIALGGRVRRRS